MAKFPHSIETVPKTAKIKNIKMRLFVKKVSLGSTIRRETNAIGLC